MIPKGISISRHALQRFQERWPHHDKPGCWEETLRTIIVKAEEEDLQEARVCRLLNNDMTPARYFTYDGWRFVTDVQKALLLTCERIIHTHPPRKRKHPSPKDLRRQRITNRKKLRK